MGNDATLPIDKVYKRDWIETRSLALETTSGNRLMPVSLPRVKWLESDPDCKYILVSDIPVPTEPKRSPPFFMQRQRRNIKWEKEDDLLLLSMMKQRMPRAEIAMNLDRTVKSIVGRLTRLGYNSKKDN